MLEAWLVVLLLWIAFAATHMGLSSLRLRPRLVAALGERGFLGLYTAVSFATFVPLVWVYLENRHSGPQLWGNPLGPISLWILYVAMGAAFTLVVAGLAQPSPASLAGRGRFDAHGVQRLTRHPVFMGVGLFGALHLLPNGFASDVVFFAGFPVFALVGCRHQDRRKREQLGEPYQRYCQRTPFLPFTGPETLQGLRELPLAQLALGVAVTWILRWLHAPLFR